MLLSEVCLSLQKGKRKVSEMHFLLPKLNDGGAALMPACARPCPTHAATVANQDTSDRRDRLARIIPLAWSSATSGIPPLPLSFLAGSLTANSALVSMRSASCDGMRNEIR